MTTRRSLLLGTAAVALSACSGSATTPAQVITDIENLGGALTNDLALLGPTLGIPAATITTIKTVVADIVSVGNNVASGILRLNCLRFEFNFGEIFLRPLTNPAINYSKLAVQRINCFLQVTDGFGGTGAV